MPPIASLRKLGMGAGDSEIDGFSFLLLILFSEESSCRNTVFTLDYYLYR